MVTIAKYELLNEKYKEVVKLAREQSKNLKRLSEREVELERDVEFHKNLFNDMKRRAEDAGSETAVYRQKNIVMIEELEKLKRDLSVKK